MTNPNDPWGQRPEDSPTERLGSPGMDSTKPYGGGGFDEWGQPSNPTMALPPHDEQWGAYESGYPAAQQPPPQQPPPGYGAPPPGYPPRPQDGDQGEPPKRNTGLWIALGLGVLALVAVGGVLAGLVFSGGKSGEDNSAAAPTSEFLAPPTTSRTAPIVPPSASGLPGLPGLGGGDEDLGATMGSITANTGTEITMSTLGGSTVRVLIDDATQVISLTSTKASELPVGDMVMVQGDKNPDGSIHAKIIISTALPGGPR
ncbi:DUF5666 domain-containing protein [Nocardia sp. NPDC050717]|uniref:DUF5666 domain-containing protein n=1 Tax=Nocardia sp. NPDC050717 TaxID=3157221 RepID=UPI00340D80E0